uniref:Uncharacterized protein n=1 Tax=Octopus bimaculoides TaxID=37653 RepID=A0A0L8FNS6_OCTBM
MSKESNILVPCPFSREVKNRDRGESSIVALTASIFLESSFYPVKLLFCKHSI